MFGPQTTEIASWDALSTAVCAEDKDLYCRGSETTMNVVDVCAEIDSIPYEIVGGTGLGSLCYNADFEYICDELNLCDTDLPANLCARNGADNTDERCADDADATAKACVEDWQTCIIDSAFDFCSTFDDLCFPPVETIKVDAIAPIPADQKMDGYGSPFFEKPHVGGSTSFDYTPTLKIVTCDFELIEPMTIVNKIIASSIEKRKLALFPGQEFRPSIQHGARVFGSYQAKTSKLLAEYRNKPKLTFPETVESSVESNEEKAEKQEFEQKFQSTAQLGEVVYLGDTENFQLVDLEGPTKAPYEIVFTNKAAFAVIEENGTKEVNLGFEFFTDMPKAAFEL
jgi:hypothetical protein